MKIALIGSAPSSVGIAPYGDISWKIWGCSPGAFFRVGRSDEWFEIHRWQPGEIGKPATQVPWFTPEYVTWLYKHPCVWGFDLPKDMPNGKMIPHGDLRAKYGDYFFTSTIAWMFAMAIERIIEDRKTRKEPEPDVIGLWGVDMAANEEYGPQRDALQFFMQAARWIAIETALPPESDLMTPPPLYGLFECTHRGIKLTSRFNELQSRLNDARNRLNMTTREVHFLEGAVDDLNYQQNNWMSEGEPLVMDFGRLFGEKGQSPADKKADAIELSLESPIKIPTERNLKSKVKQSESPTGNSGDSE